MYPGSTTAPSMSLLDHDDVSDRREIGTDVLDTPVPKAVIERARRDERVTLDERDAPLVAVLEAVQAFVDDHEYEAGEAPAHLGHAVAGEAAEGTGDGRAGNAFVDWLWAECSEQSLVEARKVTDSTLFFVATEEVWAHVADELELSATEAAAARDVHNRFAAANGLAGSVGHSLMAINASHDRLRRFTSLEYVDDEEYRGARYDTA